MSFQDIGRKNTSSTNNCNIHSSGPNPNTNIYNNATNSSQYSQNQTFHNRGAAATGGLQPASTALSDGHDGGNDYAAVSQAILQYQQNIGILSNIIQTIGTQDDGPLLQQQYNLQIDVIQQLGSKIELQLQQKEKMMANMNRTDASRSRATHIKLTRDYKWVETKYKNLVLEGRKKRNNIEAQKRIEMEQENRRNFEEGIDSDTARLQMQLRDDRIVEEIMREREEEVRNINKGMHQVNEIYKDLANIVSMQQDQIDEVEVTMESANKNAESGLQQIEKAHAKSESSCAIS